jgi:hypothetical protein
MGERAMAVVARLGCRRLGHKEGDAVLSAARMVERQPIRRLVSFLSNPQARHLGAVCGDWYGYPPHTAPGR